jgi:hypothetical protein
MSKNTKITDDEQIDRFKALAHELECEEDESTFEAALKRLAESGPIGSCMKEEHSEAVGSSRSPE